MKRKPNSHVVCIDPKKKPITKKVQSKTDLIQELKELKLLNEALEKENRDHIETISKLKKELQKENPAVTVHAGCQTQDEDLLLCEECEFPAETLYELGEHVGEFHSGLRIPCDFCADIYLTKEELKHHVEEVHSTQLQETACTDSCVGSSIMSVGERKKSTDQKDPEMVKCKFCHKRFLHRKELMKHNKTYHLETVSHCWDYEAGTCDFKDNCWFKHENRELDEIRDQKDPEMFQCKFCDDNFLHRKYLMKHNKEKHKETLKPCWNFEAGACNFKENCWFKHRELTISKTNQS